MQTAQTDALEGLHKAAAWLARKTGVTYAVAYRQMLQVRPDFYSDYLAERETITPGGTAAVGYARAVDRVTQRRR